MRHLEISFLSLTKSVNGGLDVETAKRHPSRGTNDRRKYLTLLGTLGDAEVAALRKFLNED